MQMSYSQTFQRSPRQQSPKMNPKVRALEMSTGHLKVWEVRAHLSHLQNQRDLHHEGGRQNLKIHHHPAAQAVTVSPLMKKRMPVEGGQGPLFNTDLDPHGKAFQVSISIPFSEVKG